MSAAYLYRSSKLTISPVIRVDPIAATFLTVFTYIHAMGTAKKGSTYPPNVDTLQTRLSADILQIC